MSTERESPSPPYQRVDASRLAAERAEGGGAAPPDAAATGDAPAPQRLDVRWWIIPLSVLLCVGQAVATILASNMTGIILTPTLISVVAFGTLFLTVLAVNPLLRLVFREKVLRPLHRAELMCVFTAMLVTSGISTFGLSDQLVPIIAAPWNEEWNTAQRGWEEAVLPNLNRSLYLAPPADASPEEAAEALGHIREFRQGLQPVDAAGETMPRPPEHAPLAEKLDYWWALLWQIPWDAWAGPVLGWLVFVGASYAMFYCLTYVVLGYWVQREKLIFPLAQLPEQLLPDEDRQRWLPFALRTNGFWIAFGVIFLIWGWNGAIAAEWIPGLERINLGMSRTAVNDIVAGGVFEGLAGGSHPLQFLIIFTAIGVAFLLPTEISFSLWFYFLVGKAIILGLVWLGHGQTGADFPSDHSWENNIVTGQGGGALMMFAAISLGRAVMDFVRLGRGMTPMRKLLLAVPVIGLTISLAVIFAWLMWNDLPLVWALIVTAVMLLVTMGLMRVVAEGGVYWFQVHTGPVHLYHTFGLGQVFRPALAVVPLLPIHWILYWDTKTFLAPNLANAAKMQESVNTNRAKFHLNIVLCIVISVLVAIGFTLFLTHLIGAQQMHSWFYSSGPTRLLDNARDLVVTEAALDQANAFSYVFGAGWVMFTMFIRGILFWFPHPIGYVMLLNPLMAQLWFSLFLGWIAKKFVVQYGGKETFDRTRPIFIGVIMGELMAILTWAILGISYGFEPGVTLNRHGP